jgi:hypothetical protein
MTTTHPATAQSSATAAVVHTRAILALALAVRLIALAVLFSLHPATAQVRSRTEVFAVGLSLVQGHGFSSPFFAASGPTAFLSPGYPFVIAAFFRLLGVSSAAFVAIVALQTLFSVLTVWLVLRIAQDQFDVKVANLAGCLCALSLPLAAAPFIVWETCLSSLLLLGFFAAVPHLRSRNHWVAAGALTAVAALINPSLIPAFAVLGFWQAWRRRIIPWAAILVCLLLYAPWPARNLAVMHAWIPLRSNFGYELWMGNHAGGTGNFIQDLNPEANAAERAQFVARGELGFMRWKSDTTVAYIRSHPRQFFSWTLLRIGRFWTATHGLIVTGAIFSGLALLGLVILWRSRPDLRLYAIPLLIYPLPYYITHADARFRYVIDPLLCILAAYAVVVLWTRLRIRQQRGVAQSQSA